MAKDKVGLIIIGGSAGSLEVLLQVLPKLKENFSIPIVIVLHRKSADDSLLVDLLSSRVSVPVREIEEKDPVNRSGIYIAPADYHLLFEEDGTFSLDYSEKVNYSRPSIDVVFESAAGVYGSSLVTILLSGANADGTEGCKVVIQKGGITIAQDPDEAEVAYMPGQAIAADAVSYTMKIRDMISFLNAL
ncbi:MAG: chemotaxis protein CheB [Bacteroidetes bacterium 46-16]|nr:MAG: chemotaxis protein CheB [Bacteroidetes bacterium 46-16]